MKTALVTGSSRGIGRSIALALADEGFNIIVNYSGNEQKAKQVVQAIIDKGQKAVAIKADVSDHEEVKSMIDQSIATFGSLDCIVNNAGITRDNLAMRMKREDLLCIRTCTAFPITPNLCSLPGYRDPGIGDAHRRRDARRCSGEQWTRHTYLCS